MDFKRIFITGGSGTIGQAIIRKAMREGWNSEITVYSRDPIKHHGMKKKYREREIRYVIGDVTDYQTLELAMAHHDLVIHAAAIKHIPECEYNPLTAFEVNVAGSLHVLQAAVENKVQCVVGISTDKACYPVNVYGSTKLQMERCFQHYSLLFGDIVFRLIRYGNVIESSGSVIEAWKESVARGEPIAMTDPAMTRFWLSPRQGADLISDCASTPDALSGYMTVPVLSGLSLHDMARYVIGDGYQHQRIPIRPGEKMHETLITREEFARAVFIGEKFWLVPPTTTENEEGRDIISYTSNNAPSLTKEEFDQILEDENGPS